MRTKRLAVLGLLLVGVAVAGASGAQAAQLSNITVERSQDFTTVTLHGDAAMNVTHQIVAAKDGKPHRIVIDLMGAEHDLPKNNFRDLPPGTILGVRTSQFAVSPEPVVRVVLDLQKPAAYRLETPGHDVRISISLPGDPPISRVWAARDDVVLASQGAETSSTHATGAGAEGPKTVESKPPAPQPAKPVVVASAPTAASPTTDKKPMTARKTPAPKTAAETAPSAPARGPASATPAVSAQATPRTEPAARPDEPAYAAAEDPEAPQVPMPQPQLRTRQSIDYNLPVPAASDAIASRSAGPKPARTEPAVTVAGTTKDVTPLNAETAPRKAKQAAGTVAMAPAAGTISLGAEPGSATEVAPLENSPGSRPVASLTTLPPLPELTPQLIAPRTRVMYHSQGRRDPFKPLVQTGKGYNAAALPEVGSLRLVGLLHDVSQSWGLFEDANGFGYILKKGDRVKNGSLTKLTDTRAYFQLSEFGWSRSVQLDLEPEG